MAVLTRGLLHELPNLSELGGFCHVDVTPGQGKPTDAAFQAVWRTRGPDPPILVLWPRQRSGGIKAAAERGRRRRGGIGPRWGGAYGKR